MNKTYVFLEPSVLAQEIILAQEIKPVRLHLGCWKRYHPWFTHHIDIADFPHINIKHDVRTLPMFADNSVDVIYASHILEYFSKLEAVDVLKEWNRVLVQGGLLRLAVPDFAALVKAYNDGYVMPALLGPLYGRMEVNPGEVLYHRHTYDLEYLHSLLADCHFIDVHRYDWRETEHSDMDDWSQSYLPHMDKDHGLLISLNVECNKFRRKYD